MTTHENKLRKLLNENKPTVGTRIWTNQTFFIEGLGSTGYFDYAEFVAEYASYTLEELRNFCIASELHSMGSMIKVDFQNRGFVAQKAIASGFQAINFVDCRNAAEVREAIRITTAETPQDGGCYGFPNNRFIGWEPWTTQMRHSERLNDVVRCFMIEKKSIFDELDEVMSIPGLDMVQFGPSDYSMSCGFDFKDHVKEVREAEKRMIECALKHNKRPRCEIQSVDDAQYYIDLGVKDFSMGDQMKLLMRDWNDDGSGIRNVIDKNKI